VGCCGSSDKKEKQQQTEANDHLSPLDLLKIRLAKGEVSYEEYKQTKTALAE
jgi:uncharacterized membrane protein